MFESFAPFEQLFVPHISERKARKCLIIIKSKALNKFQINNKHSERLSADLYTQHIRTY